MNIHPTNPVSLAGVSFTGGVTFTGFDNNLSVEALVLASGERVLLADNEAAFQFRYRNSGATGVILRPSAATGKRAPWALRWVVISEKRRLSSAGFLVERSAFSKGSERRLKSS